MPNLNNIITDQIVESDIESNGDVSIDRLEALLRDFCDSGLSKQRKEGADPQKRPQMVFLNLCLSFKH